LDSDKRKLVERFADASGRLTAWLTLFMVVTTFVIVVLRYGFGTSAIWLQEAVVWMHATVFMVGAAYTLLHEGHVRVDVFYRGMSAHSKAWVDVLGVVLLLLPMCAFLAWKSWDFAITSWTMHEASRESGGLPYPVLPMVKSVLIIMPVTVAAQGVAMLTRSVAVLRRAR
jgi:TRAP-type mannitol/chloroaromatic compound transport system permease small subunit